MDAESADFLIGVRIGAGIENLVVGFVEGELRVGIRGEAEAYDGLEGFRVRREREGERVVRSLD